MYKQENKAGIKEFFIVIAMAIIAVFVSGIFAYLELNVYI